MAIASLASDLDSIIQHAGVSVTIAAVTDYGVLRKEEIEVGNEDGFTVVGTHPTLTLREGKFSGLGQDVAVVANGTNYKIRDPGKARNDGTRKVVLVEASP